MRSRNLHGDYTRMATGRCVELDGMVRVYAAALAVLFLSLPAASQASPLYMPTPLSAADVLDRAKTAQGALDPGTYVEVTQSHQGGLDRTRTITMNGSDYASISHEGPFTVRDGRFQHQMWDQDENGIVTLSSNFHTRENPDLTALSFPDRWSSGLTMLGITSTKPYEYAIDVHPAGGEHEILYYDATTFLPTRTVRDGADQRRHVIEYGDYRTTFGLTQAFRYRSHDGDASNDYERHTVSFDRATAADFAIPATRALYSVPAGPPLVLAATEYRGDLVLPVTINASTIHLAIDSGAASMTIDPAVAAKIGLAPIGRLTASVGGAYAFSRTIVPHLAIGDLQVDDVVLGEVTMPRQLGGALIAGLLGHDFLASAPVGLDFRRHHVMIYPAGSPPPISAQPIPIDLDDYVPRAVLTLNGVSGHFLIDTGASVTMIFKRFADVARLHVIGKHAGGQLRFLGGVVKAGLTLVDHASIGGTDLGTLFGVVPESSLGERAEFDGVIGRDILANYIVTFDYPNRRMYLEKAY